ncbi:hypothetical protein BH10BAC1_BH10BAC1_08630 [soil metagenome]
MIEMLAIRTRAKAVYTTKNIGHYGLGFDYYTHFTSPIRRYPDVMVHRLLQHYLDGGKNPDIDKLEEQCKHSSDMEKLAADAERSSIKYKQVQYLTDKIGQEFDGVISGVTEWGIFVEIIENHCEGMVRLRELRDDAYYFDEDNYCLRGRKFGKVLTLGDTVRIEIKRADLVKKQLDFALVEVLEEKSKGESQKSKGQQNSFSKREQHKAKGKNYKQEMKSATQRNAAPKESSEETPPSKKEEPKKPTGNAFLDEGGLEVEKQKRHSFQNGAFLFYLFLD